MRTLSTRRRSPRHCQSDLVRDEFAASLTCTRHLRQADCSALSPRDALLSHDLCPQLRAPLSHAETRCSNHTLRPHLRCYYRSALSPRDALLTLVPPSPAVPFSPSHPTADTSRDRAVAGLATAMSEYVPHAHMRVLTPACHTRFTRTDLASHERLAPRASAQVPAWVRGWVGEQRCGRRRIGNGRDGSGYECEAEAIDG